MVPQSKRKQKDHFPDHCVVANHPVIDYWAEEMNRITTNLQMGKEVGNKINNTGLLLSHTYYDVR